MLSTTLSVVLGDGSPRKQTHLVSIWEEEEEDEKGGSDSSSLGIWGGSQPGGNAQRSQHRAPPPPAPREKTDPVLSLRGFLQITPTENEQFRAKNNRAERREAGQRQLGRLTAETDPQDSRSGDIRAALIKRLCLPRLNK